MTEGEERVALHVVVTGVVQGVWFRASTRREAQRLGVTGWIRNRADGSVEGHFEGPPAAVEALKAWCREGPPAARVDRVDGRPVALEGFRGFEQRG